MARMDCPPARSNPIISSMKAPEVLIVEDEKLLRLMMAKLLQISGYRVFICRDSLQALELVEKKSFDLVITDLMMAGATGMDVLRATQKCYPRAKVIITTGTPSSETLLEAKREGAYAYLRKPFQLKHFLSILKDAIEHTKLLQGYQYEEGDGRGAREAERGM
ncbi:MAG: response regulator [Deltaproteobacteria bacterium]|nr:response regulator [Deltaproteobacteria bacterium]